MSAPNLSDGLLIGKEQHMQRRQQLVRAIVASGIDAHSKTHHIAALDLREQITERAIADPFHASGYTLRSWHGML